MTYPQKEVNKKLKATNKREKKQQEKKCNSKKVLETI